MPTSPALFAGQALQIDRVAREHASGFALTDVSSYRRDQLLVPCTGSECRATLIIVKRPAGTRVPGPYTAIDHDGDEACTLRWIARGSDVVAGETKSESPIDS